MELVERIIERLEPHIECDGATPAQLDALESILMVELPPTLRRFLEFDFTFRSFGSRWRGKHRFGPAPSRPKPKVTSIQKMAEAMTEQGWTHSRVRTPIIRLPNLPDHPWNGLYLGEPRRDGELPILGFVNDETNVIPYVRYTAFDLYLVEQAGLATLTDAMRLDDIEAFLSINPELRLLVTEDEHDY